ncbi:MAG: S-layer homology domain-containing protein, partial [Oscillospiraceae bacterium]|nr:S-layer homology domain-containing protein [Oscillospiraceae bacterium]
LAPDLGYPEQTGNQPNRYQWVQVPLSHNTVVVDEANQVRACKGTPYHFDSEGKVRVMDADSNAYPDVNEYRRSVIMVDVDDSVSYGVDFFHVNGGEDHLYSFHSQSDELTAIDGLGNVSSYPTYTNEDGELIGTYAGPDVAYGPDPGGNEPKNVYPLGYTWLKNVRTYNSPEKDFSVEFKVKDWRSILSKKQDIRLRMTMVSDEPMDEVSFVTGLPPQRSDNKQIGELEYVLVRNKGKELDTTFTTVLEPYIEGEKYIENIEKLPMERDNASRPGLYDSFSAIKVEHVSGRVDYVMYSTNTDALYTVTDGDTQISFRGFAGVLTLENGNVAYRYLNDGDILELSGTPIEDTVPGAYTGTVESFTTDYVFDNFITYTPAAGEVVDTDLIKGKYVYIENDGVKNSIYEILDAEPDGDNIKLSLGNTTLIRSFVDAYDPDAGYVYNIAKGQSLRIPLSEVVDYSPVVAPIDEVTVSAGSSITIPFSATSPMGKTLSFNSSTLPRGMSVNAETQTITWKPDSSQVGENHVALIASDGTLETAVHFTVTVYGSTTSKPSTENSGTSSEGTGSAGGGGGGAAPTNEPEDTADTDKTNDDESLLLEEMVPSTGEADEVEKPQFTDLTNHAWAADAINELAADGIIKGTTANTFSPANNITRADFALLLVRAFNLTSDNEGNFADVTASDYFASELAIARNTGIVNGIGDNKYAPRNTITRQDMMVIVYRAIKAFLREEGGADEVRDGRSMTDVTDSNNVASGSLSLATLDSSLPEGASAEQYPDYDTVADYAKEAVTALISAGLVNGKSGLIAPADYTTRAEVAVLIKRILDYTK